ncbi:MAG: transporter related [Fibrobacteres bacterium]|nr:transporter related [Fibrobacterota bacterium]
MTGGNLQETLAPLLRTENLAVGYRAARGSGGKNRDRQVLSGIDLELRPGELVCLLGPNGAGKSTLLRTLAGLQAPLSGRLLVDGEDFFRLPAEARARKTAIVLTERIEAGNLSVYALAALGRHPHTGWSGRMLAGDSAAVRRGLEEAGAWELRDRLFDELSDGEKQRVMLARALAQEPALLLLDEPTAFLDLPRRVETMRSLRNLARQRGRAVLLSTHDLDLAMRAADRLWLLPPGGPVQTGLPEDLALRGAVGSVFDQGDVAFDPSTGQFRIHGHPEKWAGLSGDPVLMLWTARALEREGFGIAEKDAPIRIAAERRDGAPAWECFDGASGRSLGIFPTLEALSTHLRG